MVVGVIMVCVSLNRWDQYLMVSKIRWHIPCTFLADIFLRQQIIIGWTDQEEYMASLKTRAELLLDCDRSGGGIVAVVSIQCGIRDVSG